MFRADFDFNKKKIDATFNLDKKEVIANFDLKITPNISHLATKEELINATATYIHEQGVASETWEINHNLNKYPSVALVDSAGTQFQARVEYIDENTCIVYMNGATKGKAYLN